MDLRHQGHKEQSPLSSEQGSAFSLIPPPPCIHLALTAALIPAMPSTEAIGNNDNCIKEPFEIPLGFGWFVLGLEDVGGMMHDFVSGNRQGDITSFRSWPCYQVDYSQIMFRCWISLNYVVLQPKILDYRSVGYVFVKMKVLLSIFNKLAKH